MKSHVQSPASGRYHGATRNTEHAFDAYFTLPIPLDRYATVKARFSLLKRRLFRGR